MTIHLQENIYACYPKKTLFEPRLFLQEKDKV